MWHCHVQRHLAAQHEKMYILQICSLKSAAGGSPVEFSLLPLSEHDSSQGWKLDSSKIVANAGERKPLQISLSVPRDAPAASAAAFGEAEYMCLTVEAIATGGTPSMPASGRKHCLRIRALILPQQGKVVEPITKVRGKK
jgi:hypothetical protein